MQTQRDPTEVMGRRIAAYLIDWVLISGVAIAILAATKQQGYTGAPADACRAMRVGQDFSGQCLQIGSRVYTWKSGGLAVGYGLAALAGFVNLVLLQGLTGASIGKLIVGLRVVNAEGKRCGVGRAFVRWLLLIFVDGSCFLVGLLVSVLTHPHRRVGDMAGGTYVVALADVGQPVVVAPAAYQYQYGQPGPPGWAPPGAAPPPAPGWAPPGAAPPPAPGWGTAPPPAWGAPPPPPAPTWGAPPPAAPPAWGTPAAPPAWNAPPPAPVAEPAATPPPPAQTPPPPPPAADPAPPAQPDSPAEGESWWSKAIGDDDEEPEN